MGFTCRYAGGLLGWCASDSSRASQSLSRRVSVISVVVSSRSTVHGQSKPHNSSTRFRLQQGRPPVRVDLLCDLDISAQDPTQARCKRRQIACQPHCRTLDFDCSHMEAHYLKAKMDLSKKQRETEISDYLYPSSICRVLRVPFQKPAALPTSKRPK